MTIKKQLTLSIKTTIAILCLGATSASAFAPTNFFAPYDPNLRMPNIERDAFQLGMNIEYGATHSGRNWESHKRNVLQLYNDTEATIPMLMNPTATLLSHHPAVADVLNKWGFQDGAPTDDGIRGHIKCKGKFSQIDVTLWGSYIFPIDLDSSDLYLSAYLPIRGADVKDIRLVDQTKEIYAEDLQIREDLTNSLATNLRELGDLDLGSYSTSGVGDLVLMLNWYNRYPQDKESLKNVELFAKIGLSIPTAPEKKVNKAFSVALGNDGAWGMPIGLGIALEYDCCVRIGADIDFLVLFDKTKTRRLKTEDHQTEFFLLNKGKATKDHGLTWKFNLFAQGYRFCRGLSVKTNYEYIKHDDDRLTAKSDEFSYQVINTARSLREWSNHALIFSLNYDFMKECEKCSFTPQLNVFYKLPIAGKGTINPDTFGGQLCFNF